jgi:hypothetical protein
VRVAPDGTNYHATVRPKAWWLDAFAATGLVFRVPDPFEFEDYPRGNGNNYPTNFSTQPDSGFHFSLAAREFHRGNETLRSDVYAV